MKKNLVLLSVITFISLSLGIFVIYPKYSDYKNMKGLTQVGLQNLADYVISFKNTTGSFPKVLDEIVHFENDRFHPIDADKLLDPWGTPLRYSVVDESVFEIRSAGIDKKFNSWDDYSGLFHSSK